MVSAVDQIAREQDGTIDALWADFTLLWTQYQSWQEHDRLMAESHDRLNMAAPAMADDLERLFGKPTDLENVGQQLRQALSGLTVELNQQKSRLSTDQQNEFVQIKTRLEREQELRGLSRDISHEREH